MKELFDNIKSWFKNHKLLVKDIVIAFSSVFTLIMLVLPWVCLYKESTNYNGYIVESYPTYISFFEMLFNENIYLYNKIVSLLGFLGVIVSIVIYVLGFSIKDKKQLLFKISSIVLFVSSLIFLTNSFSSFYEIKNGASVTTKWIDFMTIEYGLLIIYNSICLYLVNKKESINQDSKLGLDNDSKTAD